MAELRRLVSIFAMADAPVLICGESGVGKGTVAAALHAQSPRANGRFIAVDCDETLDEAELFGRDAGASRVKEGLIAAVGSGSIFLNDIDKLTPAMQSKLLRVMETGSYRPLGATAALPSSARFLAATGVDLETMAAHSLFKSELFYLLSSLRIQLQPLRTHKSDVPVLARFFLESRSFHRAVDKRLTEAAIDALTAHDWPGNVRELRNAIERGVIMSAGAEQITPEHLGLPSHAPGLPSSATRAGVTLQFDHQPTLEEIRETYIRLLLDTNGGNRKQLAQVLGMSERNTYRMLKKMGL